MPNFRKDAERAVQYEGLPPLIPPKTQGDKATTVFLNVRSFIQRTKEGLQTKEFRASPGGTSPGVVVVEHGKVTCSGDMAQCSLQSFEARTDVLFVDLEGGSIVPGLTSYGSLLGLEEINQEPSTNDGVVFDPLKDSIPALLGGHTAVIRASDGLQFGTRDALYVYRSLSF